MQLKKNEEPKFKFFLRMQLKKNEEPICRDVHDEQQLV